MPPDLDRIRIEGIEFHGFHGVPEAERELGHRYRVDVDLELDLHPAGVTDDLSRTVDYADAAREVIAVGTGEPVRLVETLAERMAARLIARFPLLHAVELHVTKVQPPVPVPFQACGVRIRRTRET